MDQPVHPQDALSQRRQRGEANALPARGTRRQSALLEAWPLVPILALASLLRLVWPGVTQFSYDEARLSSLTLEWVSGGSLPLVSMTSSVGLHNPPLSVYLFAIPFGSTRDPAAAMGFVGLLNVAAVLGCYALAHRWGGRTAAWTSALLFAASPWAVLYSRSLWGNSLLPPFVLLCVAVGYLGLVEGRQRWLWVLPVAVALTAQLHWYGFALIPWTAAMLLLFRRRARLWPLLGGTVLGVLTWVPYLAYQAVHWREESQQILARAGGAARVDAQVLRRAWEITTGEGIHALVGPEQLPALAAALPPYRWLFPMVGALVVAAVGWLALRVVRSPREREREIAMLLLLWIAAAMVPYLRHGVPVQIHYLIVLFPAVYLAVGLGVAALMARRPRVGQGVAALVVVLAVGQAALWGALLNVAAERATPGGMGTPLGYWQAAAEPIRAAPVCEVKIVSEGAWPIWQEEPAIWDALLHDDPRVLFWDAREDDERPAYEDGRTLIVLAPLPEGAAAYASELWDAPTTMAPVPLRAGEGEIRLLHQDGGLAAAQPGTLEPARFANGMELLGYATSGTPAPGGTVRLFLHWRLTEPPEAGELYAYNHLLDAAGTQRGQADGIICPMNQWHVGQTVWAWYDIAVAADAPPGPYQVRTGVYSVPEIQNVQVLNAAGQPADSGVTLPVPMADDGQ